MNKKILIADDEKDLVELLEYNLLKEGYEVFKAYDGKEAIATAKEISPDLIILDIMMPEYDGVEVCEILRGLPQFKNTLIVFLTARSEDFTQIVCYENGGDDYIVKPIKPKVLISRIKAIFRRNLGNDSEGKETISIGEVKVNLEEFQVYKKEEKIALAKKEFELLVLLASKPGKLFTREEIFNKIWGADQFIGDRTIDVHIRKLREKIGNSFIKTVKGMGYKVEI